MAHGQEQDGNRGVLSLWFAYGSTYTYLSVMRVEQLARARGIRVDWRPFNLLNLFRDVGLPEGPFKPYPAKLNYMWRDLERRAALRGLPYRRPEVYPPKNYRTACAGLVAAQERWCAEFTRTAFHLHWVEGILIGTDENLHRSIAEHGHDADRVLHEADSDRIKQDFAEQTEQARALGIFGAPSFVVGKELFWGDDRLEDALDYAAALAPGA
jgi:2-hydroxychromene-2-carboxylate isomerase